MPKIKDDTKIVAIHTAAMKLVIKTGFGGLKMADVAKGAGIATGTLYIYYKSKEELINDVFIATKKEIVAILLNPEHQSDTFYHTFKKMWFAYFSFCFENPEKMMFVEQFYHSGYISEENIALGESWMQPINLFLENAKSQGLIKPLEVKILHSQTQGAIHEIIRFLIKDKKEMQPMSLNYCFDMAWDAIRK